MKVIIAGSRDLVLTIEQLDAIIKESGFEITQVVCGEARGIDTLGKEWANMNDIHVMSFPAVWMKNGVFDRGAGIKRNYVMAKYADALIAVWDGDSSGTANMIMQMKKLDKKYFVKTVDKSNFV